MITASPSRPVQPSTDSTRTGAQRRRWLGLAPLLFGVALATGCTINRVGCVTSETRTTIPVSGVRIAPKLADGKRPAGMVSLKIMPILRSNPESRAALGKESAAQLGYDTVSGLECAEDVFARWPLGIALLSDTAQPAGTNRAKFTVCMPLPTSTGGKMSSAAADYVRRQIQFVAAQKGYYVYFTDVPGVTLATLQDGTCNLAALAEPIGAAPDFVMLGELTKVQRTGTEFLLASQDLEFNLTLVDIDSRKPVWSATTKGGMVEGILGGIAIALASSHDDDLRDATRNTTAQALKTLPAIPQYRKLK